MPEVTFRIKRYDPEKGPDPHWAEYAVVYEASLTVLEGLFYIQEKIDPSLAFRYCCRAAVCGSCAMYIDGRYRLACQTNVRHLGETITIAPLPQVPVVKDLCWDMTDFFEKYEAIQPWIIRDSDYPEKETCQSLKDRAKLNNPVDCILCASCYSSCPSVWADGDYLGPAALLWAYRFEVDSRDEAGRERLPAWNSEDGVYRCHTITNCVEACPKELNPTDAIQWLKKAAVRRRILGRRK
jgi:succinate dehydrogenase / fumarate reductase iron-sulfur subunit